MNPLLVGLISLLLFAGPIWSAPRIISDKNRIDLGDVRHGQDVERQFELRNEGDSDLQIDAVRYCCGVKVNLEKRVLAPGEQTIMRVSFKAEVRNGVLSRSVYLKTNDPHAQYYQLILSGRVESSEPKLSTTSTANNSSISGSYESHAKNSVKFDGDLIVVPRQLTLGFSSGADTSGQSRFLAIRSRNKLPFVITQVDLPDDHASFRLTPLGKSAWRVELRDIEQFSIVDHEAEIIIHTDKKDQSRIHIPIRRMRN